MGETETGITVGNGFARELTFRHLPGYAKYLLEHRFDAFVDHQIQLARETQIPLLRQLGAVTEEQLHTIAGDATREMLQALAENQAAAFINRSLDRWRLNRFPFVAHDRIGVEDVALAWHVRRRGFLNFLDAYSASPGDWKNILDEVEMFAAENEMQANALVVNAQRDLHRREQRLAGIGDFVWDIPHNHYVWSDELYRIYEWEPGSAVDYARIARATHPDDLDRAQTHIEQLFKTHEPYNYHYRIVTESGAVKTLHARGVLERDSDQRPLRIIGTLQDVTAQRIIEEDLQRSSEKLRESEHQLQTILANAPDAVIVMNADGAVESWNAKAEQTFGWSAAEVLGKPLHAFIIPERFRQAHVDGLKRFLRTGVGAVVNNAVEIRALRRDGVEIDVSLSVAAAMVHDRQLFTWFVRDITESKHAAQRLAASEAQFRLLVSGVKDYAIFMLNPEGNVATWNAGAQAIKQYRPDEIIGKHFSTFYTAEDKLRNHPQNELAIAMERGSYQEEGWRLRKDGTAFWASVTITAIRDDSGTLRGFAKVTRDLTERMHAERRMETMISELERSNAELTSFSYAASHDLQEPLRKIQTFTSRILAKDADNLSETSRDLFNRLSSASARMQRLIDDLLAYSRVGTQAQLVSAVDLNRVLADIRSTHKTLYGEKKVSIQLASPLPTLEGSAVQLNQLFENLISNAIKYAKPDTPPVIRIDAEPVVVPTDGARRGGRFCKITVADNGIGFEPEYNERIFEMFQRLHSKFEYEGTGIGLSIVRKIVQNHGGFIEAQGEPNVGATFSIFFPSKVGEAGHQGS